MCEEVFTSVLWSIFPTCRGDRCCGSCNPPCCRKICSCGFDEDDERFLQEQQSSGPQPQHDTPPTGTTGGAGASPAYTTKTMMGPSTGGPETVQHTRG